jgi:hypothetical protein
MTQEVQITVDENNVSTVVFGEARVEVGEHGKKVTVYAEHGIEARPASGEAPAKATQFSVSEDFKMVVVNGVTIEKAADGHLVISASGIVITKPGPANDTAAKATAHEIGVIESDGWHKGEIYGGIYPADNKPIWFLAGPRLMNHYDAAAWAEEQGGYLPTRKQGYYLTTLKGKGGAFTEIFNCGGSFPAGYVWLAEPSTKDSFSAWCQRLGDGDQDSNYWGNELPILSVRR